MTSNKGVYYPQPTPVQGIAPKYSPTAGKPVPMPAQVGTPTPTPTPNNPFQGTVIVGNATIPYYNSEVQVEGPPPDDLRKMIAKEVIEKFLKGPMELAKDLYRNTYSPNYARIRLAVTQKEYDALKEAYTVMDGHFSGKIGTVHLIVEDPPKVPAPTFSWDPYVPEGS